jgi:hypothetical protein
MAFEEGVGELTASLGALRQSIGSVTPDSLRQVMQSQIDIIEGICFAFVLKKNLNFEETILTTGQLGSEEGLNPSLKIVRTFIVFRFADDQRPFSVMGMSTTF